MVLTKKQRADLETLSRPLIKWLNDEFHPHMTLLVDCGGATVSEGVFAFKTEDYIKD